MRITIIIVAALALTACAENRASTQAQASAVPVIVGQDGLAAIPLGQTEPAQIGTVQESPAKVEPFNGGG